MLDWAGQQQSKGESVTYEVVSTLWREGLILNPRTRETPEKPLEGWGWGQGSIEGTMLYLHQENPLWRGIDS